MPDRLFRYIALITLLWSSALHGGEFQTVYAKDKRTEEGYTFYNRYCQIAFLNPSAHAGKVTTGDFAIMPRTDTQNRHTLDEKLARIRLFFKPSVTIRTAERRPSTVHAEELWSMKKLENGMEYFRSFQKNDYAATVSVTVQLPPERACLEFEYTIKNTGTRACTVEASGCFDFLRQDVEPLHLILEREMVRYTDGKKETYITNTMTELNGKSQSYWWRRVVREPNVFSNYFNRERIPFKYPRLIQPQMFGFSKLAGGNILIWDMAEDSKIDELELSWESERGEAEPFWEFQLNAGETRVIKFRVLTVKGLPQFNSVGEDWVFGFNAENDILHVMAVPLESQDRLSMTFSLSDARNQVLISQRNELPATTPFTPAKVDLRSTVPFQINAGYSFKLVLATLTDNTQLLESSGNMTP